jgi:hypothetical protein
MALAVATVGAACGDGDEPSAQPESVRRQPVASAAGSAIEFREVVHGSPLLAVIDWTAPEDLAGLTSLTEYGGTVAGLVERAELSPVAQVDFFDGEDLPNEGRMDTGGVDLFVQLDAVGTGLEQTYIEGATVRVRLELWAVGRGTSQVGEEAAKRALAAAPIGARIVVPLVASRSTPDTVVGLLGTPFLLPTLGAPVAIDPRLDAIGAAPDLESRLMSTAPTAPPR